MNERPPSRAAPFLVALEQCGLELQAPHVRTTKKRRIESADVEPERLPSDSLRFTGWDPDAMVAIMPGLDAEASYEVEATALCERHVRRVQSITAGGLVVDPPRVLAPGIATVVRVAVPPDAIVDGTLEIRVERVEGPDAVLSELRLYSSREPAPTLTVAGDSRGGLVGTVGAPDGSGIADATVRVSGAAGAFEVRTDRAGVFRVPLGERLSLGRQGSLEVETGSGRVATRIDVDTRHLARGLRELPPPVDRLDLAGRWRFHGGPFRGHDADRAEAGSARVPGHVIYDSLVPDDGVATLHREVEIPAAWAGRAVFLRCDGAYGRAEVVVNASLAGIHGSGATSFDVDLTPFLHSGRNDLAITLTEYTPHAVLDDMSWYAHMSLLGIWRDVFLFAVPGLHLGQLGIEADWDPVALTGSLRLDVDIIDVDPVPGGYELNMALRDPSGAVAYGTARTGPVGETGSAGETTVSGPLSVEAWSAEVPALYELEVSLARPGLPGQVYRRRVGFRRVATRGDQLLVNGAPIRVRGVNRHDSRILKGRALSAEDMREDVVNLRRANVNVIRTSHYPPSPHLLDACDELGMFLFEQPPICFSGGFDDHHWTRTNEAAPLIPVVLEVTAETVARDAGHPSVIVWDLGNESRWGPAFDAQLALVRVMDPHRPTTFSFDLNELGPENELVRRPAAERPDLRSYHYPGWDRTWQEDLEWLGSHEQPVVLDEYMPVFAPCLRGRGEAYGLAIDPGIRDYWGAGYKPFAEAALGERGVIGGIVWGGFGEVFAIPLDLTIGEGPWAHLPVSDYVRTVDHYPAEPGVFRRGDGDWGLFDAWNRPRPELWHVHEMYAPVAVVGAVFDEGRLEVELANRFCHRSLAGLEVRVAGGEVEHARDLGTPPGGSARVVVGRTPGAEAVRIEVWHPEGWLVAGWERPWPGAAPTPQEAVLAGAMPPALDFTSPGSLSILAGGRRWLRGWPSLHVLDVDMPHVPVGCGLTDGGELELLGTDSARAPIAARDWEGWITARVVDATVVFEYDATYVGARAFRAKEVGLTLRPARELTDLWWRRAGEWSVYPPGHVGRVSGYAPGIPGSTTTLDPAPSWDQDATAAGSNDYRSVKRAVIAGGATDGHASLSVLSAGAQHLRAELVDGLPELHVLDWYGGVRTLEGNHPIWSAYFGCGMAIETGTRLKGRLVLAAGERP